jgi:hypothetical protein
VRIIVNTPTIPGKVIDDLRNVPLLVAVIASVGSEVVVTRAGVGSTVASTSVAGVCATEASVSTGAVLSGEKTSSQRQVPQPSVKIPPAFSQASSAQYSGAQPHICTVMS